MVQLSMQHKSHEKNFHYDTRIEQYEPQIPQDC